MIKFIYEKIIIRAILLFIASFVGLCTVIYVLTLLVTWYIYLTVTYFSDRNVPTWKEWLDTFEDDKNVLDTTKRYYEDTKTIIKWLWDITR